jgi:hypothetical protein
VGTAMSTILAGSGNSLPEKPKQTTGEFWKEFIRVEFDKILLFALALYLFHTGQNELGKAAMYGLAVAINHNRFRWN